MMDILIKNAQELITLQGHQRPRIKKEMNDLYIIKNGDVAIKNGIILDVGTDLEYSAKEEIDASGKIVLPGFIDPHTHLVFAGSREFELDWKLNGLSYMDIMKRGGGIEYTVEKTKAASFHQLVKESFPRLHSMLAHGTTTCEAKSGYGLDTMTEQRILEVNQYLTDHHPLDIVSTFLGAHTIPKGVSSGDYVDIIINEMIPMASSKADFCDVFCEEGFFTVDQARMILEEGKKHGLTPKIHADELTNTKGAQLAAEVKAISAEHLLHISSDGIKAMAQNNVIGVLLPGTPFCSMMNTYAPARSMIDAGVPVALATDLNPNCYVENMQFMIQLGCFFMRMTPAEAICAATFNASCAINKEHLIGSIEIEKHADVIILDCPSYQHIPYHFGINHVETVIKNGKLIQH
ncbi:MAG: imidazolonepropionase [Thermoplasmatota archaeon]